MRAERAMVAVVVVVQTITGLIVASHSYFFADDFLFFQLARDQRFDAAYLRQSAFGHLIPVFQFANKVMSRMDPIDYRVAAVLMVLFHLACTIAMWRLLRRVVGPNLVMGVALALFAVCIIMFNGVVWWGASLCLLPSTAANIAAFTCFLNWDRTRRTRWLVALAATYLFAMAAWEKSALTAVWIAAFSVLILDQGATLKERVQLAWRRWPAWAVFAVLGGAYVGYYVSGNYLDSGYAAPSTAQLGQFLGMSAFEGLFPPLLGIRYPSVGVFGITWLGWALPAAIVLTFVGWTSSRSPRARAAWVWFVAVYLLNQLVVGQARIGLTGVHVGREYRYQIDNLYLLIISGAVAGLAALRPRPTEVTPPGERATRARAVSRVPVRVVALGVVVVFALVWSTSLRAIVDESPGSGSRRYFDRFDASYDRLVADGADVELVDRALPEFVILSNFFPYNLSSVALGQIRPDVRFSTSGRFVIDADGTVRPATFKAVRTPAIQADTCAPAGVDLSVDFEPLESREWILRLRFEGPATGTVSANGLTDAGERAFNGTGRPVRVSDAEDVMITGAQSDLHGVHVVTDSLGTCLSAIEVGTMEIDP